MSLAPLLFWLPGICRIHIYTSTLGSLSYGRILGAGFEKQEINVFCPACEFYGREVDSEEDPLGTGVWVEMGRVLGQVYGQNRLEAGAAIDRDC